MSQRRTSLESFPIRFLFSFIVPAFFLLTFGLIEVDDAAGGPSNVMDDEQPGLGERSLVLRSLLKIARISLPLHLDLQWSPY